MKIAAVVVWYNPQNLKDPLANIKSYCSKCEKIYIVDNSSLNNKNLAEQIKNAVYIPLFNNLGIAKALNTGCSKAFEDGFEWCMTMDQDSIWKDKELENFIKKFQQKYTEDSLIKSFAPQIKNPVNHSFLGNIKKMFFKEAELKDEFVHRVICSGNIINLKTFIEIGKFNEEFFIDEVDHEYCFRLIQNNYKIFQFNSILLNHQLGECKKTFFPNTQHTLIRSYYIIRNSLYVIEHYPDFAKEYSYKKNLAKHKRTLLLFSGFKFFKNLKMIKKAYSDYKNGLWGKYKD